MAIVFLVGMPAVGKSYWGERLSFHCDFAFTDLDSGIAMIAGKTIPEIFAREGEIGFRERESNALQIIIDNTSPNTIVACGGGTPCYNDNLQLMMAAGIVIYLQADVPHLLINAQKSLGTRPLLDRGGKLSNQLDVLLQQRKRYYEQAHYILPAESLTLATFAQIIEACTNKP